MKKWREQGARTPPPTNRASFVNVMVMYKLNKFALLQCHALLKGPGRIRLTEILTGDHTHQEAISSQYRSVEEQNKQTRDTGTSTNTNRYPRFQSLHKRGPARVIWWEPGTRTVMALPIFLSGSGHYLLQVSKNRLHSNSMSPLQVSTAPCCKW